MSFDVNTLLSQMDLDVLGASMAQLTEGFLGEMAINNTAELTVEGGRLWIKSGYNPAALIDMKAVPGRTYEPTTKRWSFPPDQFQTVYALAVKHFPGSKFSLLRLATQVAAVSQGTAGGGAKGPTVHFTKNGKGFLVQSPYNASFVDDLKYKLPQAGRKWMGLAKGWWIGEPYLNDVIELVKKHYGADSYDGV